MAEFQSYNSRNGKWVHFKNGKIKKLSDSKIKGVPVKKGKSGKTSPLKKTSAKQSGPRAGGIFGRWSLLDWWR